MIDRLHFNDRISYGMNRRRGLSDLIGLTGIFDFSLVRAGKVIVADRFYNAITNEGKNNLLNRFFNQTGTNTNDWYFGLIDATTFSSTNTSDTMASHTGWIEFEDYADDRKAWGQGSAAGQSIAGVSPFSFTFTNGSTVDLYGAFMCSDFQKGNNDGMLWNTAPFNAILPVQVDDVLNCSYTLQL